MGVPRLAEGASALLAAATHAVAARADWFLFLGDLCDPDVDVGGTLGAMKAAAEVAIYLAESGVPSVWLMGNHDTEEGGSGLSTLSPLAALEGGPGCLEHIYVAERPRVIDLGALDQRAHAGAPVRLLCLPFAPVSHAYNPAEYARLAMSASYGKAKVVVIGHLCAPGVIPGEETDEMPRGRQDLLYPYEATSGALFRMCGHYHRRQDFDPGDGGPPVVIPGAMMRLTAADADRLPSYLEIDL